MSNNEQLIHFLKQNCEKDYWNVIVVIAVENDDIDSLKKLVETGDVNENILGELIAISLRKNSLNVYDYLVDMYLDKIGNAPPYRELIYRVCDTNSSDIDLQKRINKIVAFYYQKYTTSFGIDIDAVIKNKKYSQRLINTCYFLKRNEKIILFVGNNSRISDFLKYNNFSDDAIKFALDICPLKDSDYEYLIGFAYSHSAALLNKFYKLAPDRVNLFKRLFAITIDSDFYFDLLNVGFPFHDFPELKTFKCSKRPKIRLEKLYKLYKLLKFPVDTINIISSFVEY